MQPMTSGAEPENLLIILQDSVGGFVPLLLGGLAILLFGWIVALILAAATRKGLGALRANQRLNAPASAQPPAADSTHARNAVTVDYERIGGRIVFWVVMLLAFVGMFGLLRIDGISGPMSLLAQTVVLYLPRLLMALVLGAVAWGLATLVRMLLDRALSTTRMDEKLSESAGMRPLSATLGNVVYGLILLLFLPAIVGVLQIEGLMAPLNALTADLLDMLPNIFAATVIAVVGWIVAKVVRGIVSNLLAATGVDRFSAQRAETRGLKLSDLGGTLVFVLIVVPTLIAALDALRIEAVSAPLTRMLEVFLQAVPNVIAAAAILLLAWFIGRFVALLVVRLLANLGFDNVPERIGLGHAFAAKPETAVALQETNLAPERNLSLSELAGRLALFFIMLFATVEAAGVLGFAGVHELLERFIAFGANILLGLVIFVVGYWLADVAAKAIQRASADSRGLARLARVAILGLVVAMGLRAMGVADDIVNLAFGLTLGAVAVAVALAFGLGGREAAGRVADRWASGYLKRRGGE